MTEISFSITNAQIGVLWLLVFVGSIYDIAQARVPNWLVGGGIVMAITLTSADAGLIGLRSVFGGMAVGMLVLLPFYAIGGMGAGDVKLLAAAGAFLGPWGTAVAAFFAFSLGGVIGVFIIVWRTMIRYMPFAHAMPRRWFDSIDAFTESTGTNRYASGLPRVRRLTASATGDVRIPYAPAIAGGVVLAVWYLGLL